MFHVYGRFARENVKKKIITPLDPPPSSAPGNAKKNTTKKRQSDRNWRKELIRWLYVKKFEQRMITTWGNSPFYNTHVVVDRKIS
jgi:hypothetical protein